MVVLNVFAYLLGQKPCPICVSSESSTQEAQIRRSLRLGLGKLRDERQWHVSTSNLFILLSWDFGTVLIRSLFALKIVPFWDGGGGEKGWPWHGEVSSGDKLWTNLEDIGHGLLRARMRTGFGKSSEVGLGMS